MVCGIKCYLLPVLRV